MNSGQKGESGKDGLTGPPGLRGPQGRPGVSDLLSNSMQSRSFFYQKINLIFVQFRVAKGDLDLLEKKDQEDIKDHQVKSSTLPLLALHI